MISKCEIIRPVDIHNLVAFSNINMNSHLLVAFLCRESMSLAQISQEAIVLLLEKLQSPYKKFEKMKGAPKRNYSFNQSLSFKFHDSVASNSKDMSKEEILEKGQKLFMRLADFLFDKHLTLNDVIYPKIYYKVIDGFEYQLISIGNLFCCLDNIRFSITDAEKQ